MTAKKQNGALTISLDLELHWGVRDRRILDDVERERLRLARLAALRIADLFEEFSVHATWATVGFLFARSREDMEEFRPANLPRYEDRRLGPYCDAVGADESEDPFHFAGGLIGAIAAHRGQEIATHSFSHYYCLEPGQCGADFEADLHSAIQIAARAGYRIRSYVFPRNEVNFEYLPALQKAGIAFYRGNQASAVNRAGSFHFQQRPHRRLARLVDSYVDVYGSQLIEWPSGAAPWCVGASRYLRPWNKSLAGFEELRLRRIAHAMDEAAVCGKIFHLWWHPEDFAWHSEANLNFLRRVLEQYVHCRETHGMQSLAMNETGCEEWNGDELAVPVFAGRAG